MSEHNKRILPVVLGIHRHTWYQEMTVPTLYLPFGIKDGQYSLYSCTELAFTSTLQIIYAVVNRDGNPVLLPSAAQQGPTAPFIFLRPTEHAPSVIQTKLHFALANSEFDRKFKSPMQRSHVISTHFTS